MPWPSLAAPPFGPLARETLRFQIDGAVQEVEVVRQERRLGGTQGYWICPRCGACARTFSSCQMALARVAVLPRLWSALLPLAPCPACGGSRGEVAASARWCARFTVAAAAKASTLEPRLLQAASRRAYRNGARACGDARWYDPRARKAKGSAAWTKMIVTIRCWESG